MAAYEIVEVKDLDQAWPDIRRLFLELDEYHRPLTGRELRGDWEPTFREHLKSLTEGLVLLATAAGEAIGLMNATVLGREGVFPEPYGWVDNACGTAAWRIKGVGQALLARVEAWCREAGIDDLRLNVMAANKAGIAAWQAMGFEPWSHTVRKRLVK